MNSNNKNDIHDTVQWFRVLLAVALSTIFILVYLFVEPSPDNKLLRLLLDMIPDAVVVLIAIPIIYFLFYKRGLTDEQLEQKVNTDELAKSILNTLETQQSKEKYPQLLAFYETYRLVDWRTTLAESQNHIDIVVYYFDSWVNANYESIVAFFRKPRTTMRIFVTDPNNDSNLDTVQRLFPEYSKEVIKEKVMRTGYRLAEAVREAGGDAARLEFYLVPHILNYSAQCIDNKILILSIFEMYRKLKIDSPAIIIDINKSHHLSEYWDKELKGLLGVSSKVPLR